MTVAAAMILPALFTAFPLMVRIALSLCAGAASFIGYWYAGWVRGWRHVQSVVWNADGRWFLSRGSKTWEAKLHADSWINGALMLLRWDAVDGAEPQFSMMFTIADLGPAVFRRLGIRLRIDGPKATLATDSLLA